MLIAALSLARPASRNRPRRRGRGGAARTAAGGADRPVRRPARAPGPGRPGPRRAARRPAPPLAHAILGRESYAVRRIGATIVITARDTRGLVYGAGGCYAIWTWRTHAPPHRAGGRHPVPPLRHPADPDRLSPQEQQLRCLDAGDVRAADRGFRALGASGVQIIAPVSDDEASSPLFPAPPRETLAGIARITHRWGSTSRSTTRNLATIGKPNRSRRRSRPLPGCWATYPRSTRSTCPAATPAIPIPTIFPAGRPAGGGAAPRNPAAPVYISTQGFDAAGWTPSTDNWTGSRIGMAGVFVGPQTRDPLPCSAGASPAAIR